MSSFTTKVALPPIDCTKGTESPQNLTNLDNFGFLLNMLWMSIGWMSLVTWLGGILIFYNPGLLANNHNNFYFSHYQNETHKRSPSFSSRGYQEAKNVDDFPANIVVCHLPFIPLLSICVAMVRVQSKYAVPFPSSSLWYSNKDGQILCAFTIHRARGSHEF